MVQERLTDDLVELLGEENFIRLIEAYGGVGQYIAHDPDKSEMTAVLGRDVMKILAYYYGGTPLRVPIGREYLAKHYRLGGLSNREIAERLRVTESTVYRLLKRAGVKRRYKVAGRPAIQEAKHKKIRKGSDPRQIEMFG